MKKSKVPHKLIPAEEREMSVQQAPSTSNPAAEFEEDEFDKQFWLEVIVHALLVLFACVNTVVR
jgi:hypothetical protein